MGWLLPTARMNEHWREGRRLLDRSLGPGATTSYRRMMEDKARLFLGQLLEAPEDFQGHIGLSVWRVHFVCITVDL
jgi:cytochrome P450